MAQQPGDRPPVAGLKPAQREPPPPAFRPRPARSGAPVRDDRGNQGHGEPEREQHGDGERQGRRSGRTHPPRPEQAEGGEHHHGGQGRASHRSEDLVCRPLDDLAGRLPGWRASRRSMFSTTSRRRRSRGLSPRRVRRRLEIERVAEEDETKEGDGDREREGERRREVVRHSPRNASRTGDASAPPISIASRTLPTDSRTSAAWSYTASSRTPAGSSGRMESTAVRTAAWSVSVLPFGCRATFTSAAGRPFPETIWKRSSAP